MDNVIITISRSYGSGGRDIGRRLATELGIDYLDSKLLRLASDESGINEQLFAEADETLKSTPLFRAARKVYNGEVIRPDSDDFTSNENLFRYQAKVMRELASSEACVIIGRCANVVLGGQPNVLRVYIHAPIETRMQWLADTHPGDKNARMRIIAEKDERRAAYCRYFTGLDWKDADQYDLSLDSAALGADRCVALIKEYTDIRFR
ncbi:MAG: AAA family ATPase [Acetanaerobacterium sp.]